MSKKILLVSLLSLMLAAVLVAVPVCITFGAEIYQGTSVAITQDPGGGFDNGDLNDTYRFRLLHFDDFENVDRNASVIYGEIDFQGDGTWTGSSTAFASDGSTEANALNGTYNVNPDGSFDFVVVSAPPDPNLTFTGYISRDADRQLIVMSQGETAGGDISQAILTAVRAAAAPFTASDLNGDWRFRDLELRDFEDISTDSGACSATLNCNNGNWDASYSCFESDGTQDSGTVSGTYSWNGADNAFDFVVTGEPGVAFSAYLSRDKEILIVSRGLLDAGGDISQWIGTALKVDPLKTYSNADLNATYFFAMLDYKNYSSDQRESYISYGEINFNGDGTWNGTNNLYEGDGSTDSFAISGTYSVNADGSFSLVVTSESPNVTWTGDISSNPDTAIMTRGEEPATASSGGGGGGGGGCFIDTAACGFRSAK